MSFNLFLEHFFYFTKNNLKFWYVEVCVCVCCSLARFLQVDFTVKLDFITSLKLHRRNSQFTSSKIKKPEKKP